ncbi:FAD-dependent oxidoreductase, partial [Nocardia abscessus]|uniref:FAD-dependent oxidoreductase n=1 Tax=Nocardia abscessus TaxID=120957 RepID=UPI002456E999
MSSTASDYDAIVIGGGPAGENAAAYAIAGSDRTAAIVERELVGGECSYWACVPSKALLRPGHVLSTALAMPGVSANGLDVEAVLRRRDAFVHDHDDSAQVDWAGGNGIDVGGGGPPAAPGGAGGGGGGGGGGGRRGGGGGPRPPPH